MDQKPFSRTVQDIGNGCVGVSIPAGVCEQYGIEPGDELPLDLDRDEQAVKFLLSD
jgi:antitoxin component of MazEF toxin-antitoxin module